MVDLASKSEREQRIQKFRSGRKHKPGRPYWNIQLVLPSETAERLQQRWQRGLASGQAIGWRDWLVSLLVETEKSLP